MFKQSQLLMMDHNFSTQLFQHGCLNDDQLRQFDEWAAKNNPNYSQLLKSTSSINELTLKILQLSASSGPSNFFEIPQYPSSSRIPNNKQLLILLSGLNRNTLQVVRSISNIRHLFKSIDLFVIVTEDLSENFIELQDSISSLCEKLNINLVDFHINAHENTMEKDQKNLENHFGLYDNGQTNYSESFINNFRQSDFVRNFRGLNSFAKIFSLKSCSEISSYDYVLRLRTDTIMLPHISQVFSSYFRSSYSTNSVLSLAWHANHLLGLCDHFFLMSAPLFCDIFHGLPRNIYTFCEESFQFSSSVDCLLTRYLVLHFLSGAEFYLIHGLRHALDVFLLRPNAEDAFDVNFGEGKLRLKPNGAYLLGNKYYTDSKFFPQSILLRLRLLGFLYKFNQFDYFSRLGYSLNSELLKEFIISS